MRMLLAVLMGVSVGLSQESEALGKAKGAADTLMGEIRQLLGEALGKQGYVGAINACSQVAQKKSQEVAMRVGLPLRRVSLKTRNQANRPDQWEAVQLRALEQQAERGMALPEEVHEVVKTNGGSELRYLRPITVQPVCLGCHGEAGALAPGVAEKLKTIYPADAATGYRPGQLRGAVVVTVPLR